MPSAARKCTQLLLLKNDSESDSDKSMHNLEAPIPRINSAKVVKFNPYCPKGIFDGLQEVDSFNEDEMMLEGTEPPAQHRGVTRYVRKHYMKEVVDVDTKDDKPSKANKSHC